MAKNKKHKVKFQREVQIMRDIMKESGNIAGHDALFKSNKREPVGFPLLYHYEMNKDCFALVMERLGFSLKDIRE